MNDSPIKQPSAWIPIAMSLTALAIVLRAFLTHGFDGQTDEGTGAHLFQLLMGLQILIVPYFAIKWLPRAPRQATIVIAIQIAVALPGFALVYVGEHSAR